MKARDANDITERPGVRRTLPLRLTLHLRRASHVRRAPCAAALLVLLALCCLVGAAAPAGVFAAPGKPTAKAPQGVIVATTPTFTWSKVAGATRYELRVHKGSHLLLKEPGITKLSWKSSGGLPTNVRLTWKVRAVSACGAGAWSRSLRFEIVPPSPEKAITAFSFQGLAPPVSGVIIETLHTIALTVPSGADVSALVATFTTSGASVASAGARQVSGVTANSFTNPRTYTVTAADGTTQAYVVTVTVAKSLSPEIVGEIDDLAAAGMERFHAPGALVGIWTGDGSVLVKGYGLANTAPAQAMTQGLSFRIGSITKTFTGNLVLQLVDRGKLSLDDPVSRFIPGIPDGGGITVRMLLDHSSGLFNYGSDPVFMAATESDPHRVWAPRELVAFGASNPPYFPPGQGCAYSNTNYVLLGMIVEKVSGRTLERELAARITGPLGLTHTSMAEGPDLTGDHMHGYQYYGESGGLEDLTDYYDPSIYWAAGAMVSTLDDLRVWSRALAEGRLLSPALREAMTADMRELPGMSEFFGYPLLYGLGIMDAGGWLGHSGMPLGYSSAMFYLPKKQATMVVLFNLSGLEEPGMRLFMRAAKIVFPEETPW